MRLILECLYNLIGPLLLEDFSWVRHQHGLQLFVGHALLFERGNYVVVNMEVVPSRHDAGQGSFRQPMVEAGRVMRKDHLSRMTALAHLRYGLDSICKRENGVDTETVHADV